MVGGQCGVGEDCVEEIGHTGSRFVVHSHEAAAELREQQREGVKKGKKKRQRRRMHELLPSGPRGS